MSVPDDATLGGYLARHDRAPAFEGRDGRAYSVGAYVDERPDAAGRYGAALLFVRWSEAGDAAVGHVETEFLAWGGTAAEAEARLGDLTLHEIKAHLDRLTDAPPPAPDGA